MVVDKTGLKGLTGRPLVGAITSVCSAAFLLFGYDQGVMSGVVISDDWLNTMGNPSTVIVGTITAVYDVGAVFGAILAATTAERLGRKRGLMFGCVLLIIGCVLMGACVEMAMMIVGRVFTGLGIGYITSVAPVYQSEICLPTQRGWMVACQLTMLLVGILISYWINYGLYFASGPLQWRFPLLFQVVFAIYIMIITPWLPDTPRWLMFHEQNSDRGLVVLSKLRNKPRDHPEVVKEQEEIQNAVALESEAEGSWMDLFRDNGCAGHKRFALAVGIQFMQQTSGINIVTYYAPTIFQSSLGMTKERALFVGGFLQVWYLLASFATWWLIDGVGRRRLFISMAIGMALVLIGEAICVQNGSYAAGIVAVMFVFLFEACFTWGWMAPSWVYPSEILPLKLRAKGTGLAAAADYLGNFLVVEITPPALENIGYKTYIIFAVLNVVTAIICWVFYPETAGLSLESIDELFVKDEPLGASALTDDLSWSKKFQWSVIARSQVAVKKAREERASAGTVTEESLTEKKSLATAVQYEHV